MNTHENGHTIAHVSLKDREKWKDKTLRDCIGVDFSHNEVIALWGRMSHDYHNHLIYRGEAWAIPDEYLDLVMDKYVGVVPENRWEGDAINIFAKGYCDHIVCGLPKKTHDISDCTEGRQDEC